MRRRHGVDAPRGRGPRLLALGALGLLSVFVAVVDVANGDPTRLVRAVIRTPLVLGLLYAVFRGKEWARVLTVFFCVAASSVGVFALLGYADEASAGALAVSGLIAAVPVPCALTLLLSPHVKSFLHFQANP